MNLDIVHAELNWPMYYVLGMLESAKNKRMKPGQAMMFMNASGMRVRLVMHDGTFIDRRKQKGEEPWDTRQIAAHFRSVLSLRVTVSKAKDAKAIDAKNPELLDEAA